MPFELPFVWPLPLAAASGSQEGHILVEGEAIQGEVSVVVR